MKTECDGQLNLSNFLPPEPPNHVRLPVGTLIGRVVLGEVEKAVITKAEGTDGYFFYRTDRGRCFDASEAETDMDKLQRMADANREKYKTIENYPLTDRVTVSYPPRFAGDKTRYGQVGIWEKYLYWKDECTYEFLVPYKNENALKKAYKEELDKITGRSGFRDKKITVLAQQLPMTRFRRHW